MSARHNGEHYFPEDEPETVMTGGAGVAGPEMRPTFDDVREALKDVSINNIHLAAVVWVNGTPKQQSEMVQCVGELVLQKIGDYSE